VRQLTHNTVMDRDPDWSAPSEGAPDGRIAFTRRGPDGGVLVVSPDGGQERNLTLGQRFGRLLFQGHDDDPDWHPAGEALAFTHTFEPNAGGLPAVWMVHVDGTGLQRLSRTPHVSESDPAWSPDGTHVVHVRAVDTDRDVAVMGADGTGTASLPGAGSHDIAPAWQAAVTDPPPMAPHVAVAVARRVRLGATGGVVPVRVEAGPAGSSLAISLRVRRDGRWWPAGSRTAVASGEAQRLDLAVTGRWQRRLRGDTVPARIVVRLEGPDGTVRGADRFRLTGAPRRG
jgi:hypothetical protein